MVWGLDPTRLIRAACFRAMCRSNFAPARFACLLLRLNSRLALFPTAYRKLGLRVKSTSLDREHLPQTIDRSPQGLLEQVRIVALENRVALISSHWVSPL